MGKKVIQFDDTRIEEYNFHQYKNPISINDIYINKIVVYNKILFGKQDFKYFISYTDAEKNKLLCIFHPRMSMYKRYFFIKYEKFFFFFLYI